jgi:hypothetical protein
MRAATGRAIEHDTKKLAITKKTSPRLKKEEKLVEAADLSREYA